jgi:hypothetical protein
VVYVASCGEVYGALEAELGDYVAFAGGCGLRGEGEVEVCDVGLVVLGVVEGHDLGTDVGLECLEVGVG